MTHPPGGWPLPTVALVGRPNVGKSTLFNRLTGTRRALVDAVAGTTRDPVEGTVLRGGTPFRLLDTGGLGLASDRWAGAKPTDRERSRSAALVRAVEEEVWIAAGAADVVVLVADAREGITGLEEEIADRLRRAGVRWVVAANKCDGAAATLGAAEFHRLGVSVYPISAAHGTGVDDLLLAVAVGLPQGAPPGEPPLLRVAFAGRPNVGKSSMLNRILGEKRAIVSEIPGTTRDQLEARLVTSKGELLLIDTAGLRRGTAREMEAAMRGSTQRALLSCDVAIVLLDAEVGMTHDDQRAIDRALGSGAGVVLGLNKWDLVENARGDFQTPLRKALGTAAHVPFVACSAATGRGADVLLETALEVGARRAKRMKTGRLQRILVDADEDLPAAFRPKFLTQVETSPPRFVLFARGKATHGAMRRIERAIRDAENFEGVPLPIEVRRPAERERAPRPVPRSGSKR